MYNGKVEVGLDYSQASEISDNDNEEEEIDSDMKGQSNDHRGVDKNKKQRNKIKYYERCSFEMIDVIAKTMSELDKLQYIIF